MQIQNLLMLIEHFVFIVCYNFIECNITFNVSSLTVDDLFLIRANHSLQITDMSAHIIMLHSNLCNVVLDTFLKSKEML